MARVEEKETGAHGFRAGLTAATDAQRHRQRHHGRRLHELQGTRDRRASCEQASDGGDRRLER